MERNRVGARKLIGKFVWTLLAAACLTVGSGRTALAGSISYGLGACPNILQLYGSKRNKSSP